MDDVTRKVWVALVDQLGGERVASWVDDHYRRGETIRNIAAKHGVSVGAVHRRITKMRSELSKYGLLPASWQSRECVHVLRNSSRHGSSRKGK